LLFIILIFLSAFLLEGIGTITSVIGLTQLFSWDWIIVSLAVTFDLAKLMSVSFLYKFWRTMPKLLKLYMTIASMVLMVITSTGAAGYLSSTFQKGILPTKSIEVKVSSLEQEKTKLEARKVQIDQQIAQLPSNQVKGRARLIANFKSETEHLNQRLIQIDEELPKIKIESIDKTSHAGPITYLATALKIPVESAIGYIIGLIIFVFDPLAIALILAGNFLIDQRSKRLVPELPYVEHVHHRMSDEPVIEEVQSEPVVEEIITEEPEKEEPVNYDLELEQIEVKPEPVVEEIILTPQSEEHYELELEEIDDIEVEPLPRSILSDISAEKVDVAAGIKDTSPIIKYYKPNK
jgi:hypothetical protein